MATITLQATRSREPCSCASAGSAPLGDCVQEIPKSREAYGDDLVVLDAHALAGHEARDRPEHRDAVVAARFDGAAAARPGRDAADAEAVVERLDAQAEGAQRVHHC